MTDIIDLGGTWDLFFGQEGDRNPTTLQEAQQAGWRRIDAKVPGNVELDLARAGIEKDPFFGTNLYDYRKYEFFQWWLRKSFTAPARPQGSQILLRLEGLGTYGTIWLNGAEVGAISNMLVAHEFNISALIKWEKENEIAIQVESALNKARAKEYPVHLLGTESHDEMVALRMPAHSFGWDIMPRFPSAGIWRKIHIGVRPPDHFTDVYYATTRLTVSGAELAVRYRFQSDDPLLQGYSVRVRGTCGESRFERTVTANFVSGGFVVKLADPKLWWPRGYGEPNLYDVELSLLKGGAVVDTRRERIGIRTTAIERRYEPGDRGEFKIHVNGEPIMAMGSNWVPLDAFHSRDAERLPTAFALVNDTGLQYPALLGRKRLRG